MPAPVIWCSETLNEAWHLTQETGEEYYVAEIHRLKGELMLADGGDPGVAEASLLQALETARPLRLIWDQLVNTLIRWIPQILMKPCVKLLSI